MTTFNTDIIFGQIVRDNISNFTGKVRSFNFWDNGCMKVGVQGEVKDGKIPDCEWIDVQQLELVKDVKKLKGRKLVLLGGDIPIKDINMKIPKA